MIIEVERLVKHYGEITALDGASFSVNQEELFITRQYSLSYE